LEKIGSVSKLMARMKSDVKKKASQAKKKTTQGQPRRLSRPEHG